MVEFDLIWRFGNEYLDPYRLTVLAGQGIWGLRRWQNGHHHGGAAGGAAGGGGGTLHTGAGRLTSVPKGLANPVWRDRR